MENPTNTAVPNNLATAIRELQRTASIAAQPTTLPVLCDDGKGGKLEVPVSFLPGGDGKLVATPLLEVLDRGTRIARELRLSNAAGPDQRQGVAAHQALQSFIDHANRFRAPHSAVWADAAQRRLVSVLDYHPEGADSAPRWGKHRGVYSCPLSEAWLAWGGGKVLELSQEDFAELLDGRDRELYAGEIPGTGKQAPDPAALISLAANLEVFSKATAKRERDPQTGRLKITYSEEKGVAGEVRPPPSFVVLIPIFQDAGPQPLEVRLRVAVEGGHAKFQVQIHAAGDVLRFAFEDLCDQVRTATELPLFIGTPEA